MREIEALFEANRRWAAAQTRHDADYFRRLAAQQKPHYLWIGCADSRVPANVITGLAPGEVFVHRNVGNLVRPTDPNCLAAIHYAVEVLAVRHVILCGHYGCGGVAAALDEADAGPIAGWLRPIRELAEEHREELHGIAGSEQRRRRLCELNVAAQVAQLCATPSVQQAWRRGRSLTLHGWIYGLEDGLLHELAPCIGGPEATPGTSAQE